MNASASDRTPIAPGHVRILIAAAAATWLLVTMGGLVCITGSTYGCPDWPGCFGRALPPMQTPSLIEWTHRVSVLLAAPLVLTAALVGWRRSVAAWVRVPPMVAVGLFAAVSVLGAFAVLTGLPRWAAVLDLGFALLALALVAAAAVAAVAARSSPGLPGRLRPRDALGRLSVAATGGAFLVFVGGVWVARPGSVVRCVGWPLLDAASLADAAGSWVALERYGLAAATTVAAVALPFVARRGRAGSATVVLAALPAALVVILLGVGTVFDPADAPIPLRAAYVALTTALWVSLVALSVRTALPTVTQPAACSRPSAPGTRGSRRS